MFQGYTHIQIHVKHSRRDACREENEGGGEGADGELEGSKRVCRTLTASRKLRRTLISAWRGRGAAFTQVQQPGSQTRISPLERSLPEAAEAVPVQ